MSSDGKEPGWHGSGNPNWGQSLEHTHQEQFDELPPQSAQEDEEALPLLEESGSAQDEDYTDEQAGATRGPLEFFKQFGQYIALIIAPLIFGAFTCLFVLPLIASDRAYIPPIGLWPVTIIIILVAVAQAIGVYYAGSDNGLWILATIGGFFLFVLVGCFAIFGPVPTLVLLFVVLIVSAVLMRLYFHPVSEGYVDIVYAFGKYKRTLYPGLNILMPWEKVMHSLNVGEKQWACPLQKVQLSRDEDVVLRATISYQLTPEDAYIAATQVLQWENSLKDLVLATIQSIATLFKPNDFIAWPQGLHSRPLTYDDRDNALPWEKVNNYLFQLISDRVALWGVQVNWVRILDVSLAPHGATIVETDPVADVPTMLLSNPAPTPAPQPTKQPVSQPVQANQPKAATSAPQNGAGKGNVKVAEEPTQVVPAPVPASPPVSSNPGQLAPATLSEKGLISAYKTVQDGAVTDPDTIRRLAAKFEQVARDPIYRDKVSFDPERAAQNLHAQARKNEELLSMGQLYSDETRPDLNMYRPPE
ncbi:MAG: SPFH domain-containing protein [Chloroflexota bacterium]|nr:SPFH domain-containing protein [Chloroflexota bacterium]